MVTYSYCEGSQDGSECRLLGFKYCIAAKLADYKRIRGGVFIVEELPKGKTGKITRSLVAQMPLPVKK